MSTAKLISNGQSSPKQRVYLTSYRDNSPPSLPSPGTDAGQPSDWQGLTFFPGSSATLTACVIREAAYGVFGGIPVIAGAIFDRSPVWTDSAIPLTLSGNTLNASNLVVFNDTGSRDVSVTGNSFSNGSNAIFNARLGLLSMSGNVSGDGSPVPFYLGSGLLLTKDNTWNPQPGIHLITYGLTVAAGATLNLGAGLVIQNNNSYNGQNGQGVVNLSILGDLRGPRHRQPRHPDQR